MTISGRYVDETAHVIVDGRRVEGTVRLEHDEIISVELADLPSVGMHLLQLQTPGGPISNDFIFHVTETAEPPPAPTLGDVVRDGGWERLLGEWVDPGTLGEFRVVLSWKIADQLLELTTVDQAGATVAAIRMDPKTGAVDHSGINHSGTTVSGLWDFSADEGPMMNGRFVSPEGAEGELSMHLKPQGEDAMVLAVKLLGNPTSNLQLVRRE